MKGKEAIINRIIKDSQKIATSTSEEGVQKAQEIINAAENDAKIYRSKNRQESEREREDIIRRRITVANLEVKKLLLKAKQEIINKSFSQSADEIRKDKKNYKKMLVKMLEYAADNDTVTISQNDKDILTAQDVQKIAKEKNITLKLNKSYGKFQGGVVLSNKQTDKNLTLEVELSSLRDEIEPEIAEMLFEE